MDPNDRRRLRNWAAGQSTERLNCRIGRHWPPSISDLGKDPSVRLEIGEDGGWQIVGYCRRGCGVYWSFDVYRDRTVATSGRIHYPPGYLRGKDEGGDGLPMDREAKGLIKSDLAAPGLQLEFDRIREETGKRPSKPTTPRPTRITPPVEVPRG